MPNPKVGTVTPDVATAVKDADDVGATAAAAAAKAAKGGEAAAAAPAPLTDTNELLAAARVNFSKEEGLRAPGDEIGLKEYLTSPSIMKNRNFFILVGTCMCW